MKKYQNILKYLHDNSIPIRETEYYDNLLGSWYIEIESTPMYRFALDGRDKTIVLEVFKNDDWHCLAYDKTKSGKQVIEQLEKELSTK